VWLWSFEIVHVKGIQANHNTAYRAKKGLYRLRTVNAPEDRIKTSSRIMCCSLDLCWDENKEPSHQGGHRCCISSLLHVRNEFQCSRQSSDQDVGRGHCLCTSAGKSSSRAELHTFKGLSTRKIDVKIRPASTFSSHSPQNGIAILQRSKLRR